MSISGFGVDRMYLLLYFSFPRPSEYCGEPYLNEECSPPCTVQ